MRCATTFLAVALVTTAASMHLAAQQPPGLNAAPRGAARAAGTSASRFSSTIQGLALTSTNEQLANVTVRLRDARYGRIVDTQVTDQSGQFAFHNVEPGSYVVEIMASDRSSVLAASQLLHIDAGDALSAVVKLPFRLPPFAGLVGNSTTPTSAAAIITEAASSSILAVTAPLQAEPTCSCPNFPCNPGS
jgi:hypothetical protein